MKEEEFDVMQEACFLISRLLENRKYEHTHSKDELIEDIDCLMEALVTHREKLMNE